MHLSGIAAAPPVLARESPLPVPTHAAKGSEDGRLKPALVQARQTLRSITTPPIGQTSLARICILLAHFQGAAFICCVIYAHCVFLDLEASLFVKPRRVGRQAGGLWDWTAQPCPAFCLPQICLQTRLGASNSTGDSRDSWEWNHLLHV